MTFHKFNEEDVLHNVVKSHPENLFFIYDQRIIRNYDINETGSFTFNAGNALQGSIDVNELNVDRTRPNFIYPFITKNGSLTAYKTVSTNDYHNDFLYGDTITGSYPLSASITTQRYSQSESRRQINALENTFNFYKKWSPHFAYSSSLGNKSSQELRLISFPSIFYGSSIKKGSISLRYFVSGILSAELADEKGDGTLRQKLPADSRSGSVAGVCLYNEGFMVLTGSWNIHSGNLEGFTGSSTSLPRWIDFSTTGSSTPGTNVPSSSFSIYFKGTTFTPTLTMFAHARQGTLNWSNNPTFLKFNPTSSLVALSSSAEFKENPTQEIKNIVKSPFIAPTGSFQKTTYISRVFIYDENKNLIGITKLASPIRKKETDSYTFKMKIDI